MIRPFDLVQQGAKMDMVEMLNDMLQTSPRTAPIDYGYEPVGDSLEDFVRSPSVVGPNNEYSTPDPLMPQGELVSDFDGNLVFTPPPAVRDTEQDILGSLSAPTLTRIDPGFDSLSQFGLPTEDPFGTPDPDRARSLLRRLVDTL